MNSLTLVLFKNHCCWIFNKRRVLAPKPFLSLSLSLFYFSHSHSPPLGTTTPILPLSLSHYRQHCPLFPCLPRRYVLTLPPQCYPLHCYMSIVSPLHFSFSHQQILVFMVFLSHTFYYYYSFNFDFVHGLYVLPEHIYPFFKLFTLSLLGFWLSQVVSTMCL